MLEVHPHMRATTMGHPPMVSHKAILNRASSLRVIQVPHSLAIQLLLPAVIQEHHNPVIPVTRRHRHGEIPVTSRSRELRFPLQTCRQCIRSFRRALRKRAAQWDSPDRVVSAFDYLNTRFLSTFIHNLFIFL